MEIKLALLRYCFFVLLFTIEHTFAALIIKGPSTVVLDVESSKESNGVLSGSGVLKLWCQAIDEKTNRPVPIRSATFKFENQSFNATLSDNSYNATFVREKSQAVDTGNWRCHLNVGQHVSGKIMVLVRPVIHANSNLRVVEKESSKSRFEMSTITVINGNIAELKCPVFGNPKPEVIWRLSDSRQILASGDTYTIDKVEDSSDGTYVCSATNTILGKRYETIVERRLRIKSQFSWILPLSIILIILILLVLTIVFCEFRKRKSEEKELVAEED